MLRTPTSCWKHRLEVSSPLASLRVRLTHRGAVPEWCARPKNCWYCFPIAARAWADTNNPLHDEQVVRVAFISQ